MKPSNDIARLRGEYREREHRFAESDVYSVFNPANLFILQQRQKEVLSLLKENGYPDLSQSLILEMGCGCGGVLMEYLSFGALPWNLMGVDLLRDRLIHTQSLLPNSGIANADGGALPFPSGTFDLVLQYTAITSILDPKLRREICGELLRVVKPGGLILSYDFWLNPTNKQTRGLGLKEMRASFPNCRIVYRKLTLAPPIARRLVPVSWLLCALLEKLTFFNTHYLVAIRPIPAN